MVRGIRHHIFSVLSMCHLLKVSLNINGSEVIRDEHRKETPHIFAKASVHSNFTEFGLVEELF